LTRRVAIIAAASLVGVLLLAIGTLYLVQRDRALPNTTVAGIDVGRMTDPEIRAALEPLVSARGEPIGFVFEEETFSLDPSDVGYTADLDATVAAAMARGRTGFPGELGTRIASLRSGNHIDLREDLDDDALAAWVDEVADAVDRDAFPGRVVPDPDSLEVQVDYPHGSATVRRDDVQTLVTDTLYSDGPRDHELPVDTEPQPVSDEAVEQVAAQVAAALDGEVELHTDEDELVLAPSQLARVIEVVERDGDGDQATLVLTVDADTVAEVVGDVGDRFDTDPFNARFVTARTPPRSFDDQGSTSFSPVAADVEVEPGREGTRFDIDLVAEQLEQLLREGETSAPLALATIEPELSTERAEELAPTHLLSTFTTYHPAGQARVVNIQLLADEIDNTLVLPGEQFSINGISGRRTCERGYRPAGTIVRGELTDTCGGGTSQFGTTTFNAAFFAGVQLDQWQAHSWYFTRYPIGREATLNYPELDVKFTNTTDGAIVVRTSYTAGSITVSLYGQPIAESVSASHSGRFAPRTFSEERRETDERCEGETSVIQDGADGFSVDVVREVARTDGSSDRMDIRTVYVPRTRIVEVGTQDCGDDEDDNGNDEDEDEDEDDD
jgi:vancomycin resistance protein YoaR